MGGQRLTLASRLQVPRPRVGVGHTLQAERPDGGLANVGARWSGHQGQIRLRIERGHPGRRGCRDRGGGGGAEWEVRTPPPVPCGWGAAPLPLLTEGLAFFPSSSPLWSVTCHDPATCHSSARWESGERTALPTPRGAASPPRAAWLFCIPAGRGGQPRPGRQGRTVTRRPGQQGHLSSRACVFSGSVAIGGPQKQSSVCRAW